MICMSLKCESKLHPEPAKRATGAPHVEVSGDAGGLPEEGFREAGMLWREKNQMAMPLEVHSVAKMPPLTSLKPGPKEYCDGSPIWQPALWAWVLELTSQSLVWRFPVKEEFATVVVEFEDAGEELELGEEVVAEAGSMEQPATVWRVYRALI